MSFIFYFSFIIFISLFFSLLFVNLFGESYEIIETELKRKYAPCCTWQDESVCEGCSNKAQLDCRWERKHLLRFLYALSPALLITFGAIVVGGVFTGIWWPIALYLGYFTVFFIVETRILCSHCPYYSKEGIMLHCLANHGFIKFYKYHPEPANRFEKSLLVTGIILFCLVPLAAQIPSIVKIASNLPADRTIFIAQLVLIGVSIISIIVGFGFLFTRICTKCVNFSCPFNKVPKDLVDSYLDKNADMKAAWIDSGYNFKN